MRSALAVRNVPVLLALGGLADLDVGAALGREVLGTGDDGLTTGVEDGLVTCGRDVVVVQRGLVEDPGETAVLLGGGGSTQAGADELDRVVPVLTDLLGAGGALGVAGELGQVTLQLGPALGEVVLDALVVDAHFARRDERSVDVVHLGAVGGDGLVGVHVVLLGRGGHLVPVGDVLAVQIQVVGAGVVGCDDLAVGVDGAGAQIVVEAELEVLLLDSALLAAPDLVVPLLSGELAEADPAHDGPVGADVTQVGLTAAQTEGDDGLVHVVLLDVVGGDVDALDQALDVDLAERDLHRLEVGPIGGQMTRIVSHVPVDEGGSVLPRIVAAARAILLERDTDLALDGVCPDVDGGIS